MSRIRVPLESLVAGKRQLDEEAARYVVRVHRLRAKDTFQGFDPEQGVEAEVMITSTHRSCVECEIGAVLPASHVPKVPSWLLLGVCKSDRFEWALREATALGVTEIVPTMFLRSASTGTRARMERWRRIVVQGARQSGRGNIPRLHEPAGMDEAMRLVDESLPRLCLWERAEEAAGPRLQGASDGIVLMVGPEGGLEEEEAQRVASAGFAVVSLGNTILRTETAVVAALGAWQVCRNLSA